MKFKADRTYLFIIVDWGFFSSFFAIFYLLTDPKVLPNNFWYLFTYWNHWRPCCALLLIDRKGQLRARNCLCHQKGSIFSYMGHFYYYYCSSSFFSFFFNFIFFHFPYFFYIACTLSLKLKKNIAIKSCTIASKVKINVFIELFFLPQSKLRSEKKIKINSNFSSFEAKSTAFLTYTFFKNLFHIAALPHLFFVHLYIT